MIVNVGDRFKVKSNPITREFGIMFGTRDHSERAWPGMVGTVESISWRDMDGNEVTGLQLRFPNIRPYPIYCDGTLPFEPNYFAHA